MERSYLPAIANYVQRPRMDALIENGLDYSLVLVIAGPGYGKTLSVARYMMNAPVRLVWLRVSSHRTKAADFWEDLVQAAQRELPGYAQKISELDFPCTAGGFEEFRRLTAEAAADGARLVLVLDNYERILEGEITRFVDRLIDSDLANFTLFILCNIILPFADALPATGQFRITNRNLAFTVDEAAAMFEHYGVAVAPAAFQQAVRATGGWPLGLRLVCESNPGRSQDFSSHSPIQMAAELFEQHYFRNYPPDVQAQLILFSSLPQFSPEMEQPGQYTPRAVFDDLLRQHPFVSHDYNTGLYLLQPMYQDFLRRKQTLLSQEARIAAADAAGRWFMGHGMLNEAMDSFWEAANYDGFLEVTARLPKVRMQASLTNRILERLLQVPRSYADKTPEVDFSIAFMYMNAAEMERARALLLVVEGRLRQAAESKHRQLLLGDIYAALADISTYQNEDTGLGWMKKAFDLVPGGTRVHTPELLALGNRTAFFLPGDEAGQLERMVDYFFEYAIYADKVKNGCGRGFEYLFAAEAAYFREEMDKAAALYNSAMLKANQTGQHDIICNALWGLGRLELYYGNHKNALALLGEIEAYIDDNHLVGLYELRDCAAAYFYLQLGDVESVPSWFGEIMSGPDEAPINFARKQLTSAHYLRQKGDEAKAQAVIAQLESMLGQKGHWYEKFSLYVLKAQYHRGAGQPEAFEAAFGRAYGMVYPNDLKVILAAYGKEMMALLDQLKRMDPAGYDWAWLGEVHRDAASTAKRLQMMRLAYSGAEQGSRSALALTKRENETLHYLAQGLTQQEMAKLMGISSNAVKKHVSKIYFKLGAVNRADAIHIATINGLVDVLNN